MPLGLDDAVEILGRLLRLTAAATQVLGCTLDAEAEIVNGGHDKDQQATYKDDADDHVSHLCRLDMRSASA